MAKPKIEEFSANEIYFADIVKALSHPARVRILKILTEMNLCMCGEIVNQLPLAQATVSQHLKELKRVGLIQGDIDGPKVCYCVNPDNLFKAKKELENIFNQLTKKGALSCKTKKK
ncbi:MAG: winged helix-turn-helix transcriptional regulator [Ignavibacteria bacterium]|nr:winged helix-turn-helix transcriptional regulator [Ignavibacteria bacterium]